MSRKHYCLTPLLAALAVWLMTGCPKTPQLTVRSDTVTIGERDKGTFQIVNSGGGTLEWQADADIDGITLLHAGTEANHVEGTTATETDSVTIKVDRTKLPADTDSVLVTVRSGDVTKVITVTITPQSVVKPPALQVSPEKIDFTPAKTESTLSIRNTGSGTVSWSVEEVSRSSTSVEYQVKDTSWLRVDTIQGDTTGETDSVKVTANIEGLSGVTYTNLGLRIRPVGGTAVIVPVTLDVPSAATANLPSDIDFGSVLITGSSVQSIALTSGNAATPLQLTLGATPPWLTATLTADPQDSSAGTLELVADTSGLAPGNYSTTLQVTDSSTGYIATIPVSIKVEGATVTISDPQDKTIDFGKMLAGAQTRTITLSNSGAAAVDWTLTIADTSASPSQPLWLTADASAGQVPQKGTETIVLTATPSDDAPGIHTAEVTIFYQGFEGKVSVSMNVPPPALFVNTQTFDFGASGTSPKLLAIWNPGRGTVNWTIDTSTFPAWLRLTPDNAGIDSSVPNQFSGSVAGTDTDWFKIEIDRGLNSEEAPAYTLNVVGSGDVSVTKAIVVKFFSPPLPIFAIDAPLDEQGVPFVSVDIGTDDASFILRNLGQGLLSWKFGLEAQPNWITSLSPQQGEILPGRQTVITFSVDRTGLNYLGRQFLMTIFTNDPNTPERTVSLNVQVPKVISIGVKPERFGFGGTVSSDVLGVANFGDPDELLDFKVVSTKEWLSVFPDTGQSQGVPAGSEKDWRYLSISIDRASLDAKSASAKLIVSAFRVENGVQVPREDIAPIEVEVTAIAVGLTIEAFAPSLRIPSQVRYILMMRDIQYRTIPIADSQLDKFAPLFAIFENDSQVEITESQQFLTPSRRARGSALILLDYSGSMFESARIARQEAGEGEVADPLQALYTECVSNIITEMPPNYRIAVGLFNERGLSSIRMIEDGIEPLFTFDRGAALARLAGIEVIDHGATSFFPALIEAAAVSHNLDVQEGYLPFDDTNDRTVICITDGRLTTPPGVLSDVTLWLAEVGVRPFFIGWGDGVQPDALIRITAESGGHYYSTKGKKTDRLDPFGSVIRVPVKEDLLDWCTDTGEPCDESVAKDLKSQVVLSYITLGGGTNVKTDVRAAFDDPNDQEGQCFPEQGIINGTISHSNLPYSDIVGDVRLGQISMRTDNGRDAAAGTAEVVVRADYTPRNINHLKFRFRFRNMGDSADVALDPSAPMTQISGPDGGMIPPERFSLTMTSSTPIPAQGTVWELTADYLPNAENPLKYGEFGDLFRFAFSGVNEDFVVHMEVAEAGYYVGGISRDTKYFTCPDAMTVHPWRFLASSFPSLPGFTWTDAPPSPSVESQPEGELLRGDSDIFVPETTDGLYLNVWNMGGSWYDPSPLNEHVSLFWAASIPGIPKPILGSSFSPLFPSYFRLSLDRGHTDPGPQELEVDFAWTFDECLYAGFGYGCFVPIGDANRIVFHYTVLEPVLEVTPSIVSIPPAEETGSFTIDNAGQSSIPWKVASTIPDGVYLRDDEGNTSTNGIVYYGEPTTVHVVLDPAFDRNNLPFDITIAGTSEQFPVNPVTITVTP